MVSLFCYICCYPQHVKIICSGNVRCFSLFYQWFRLKYNHYNLLTCMFSPFSVNPDILDRLDRSFSQINSGVLHMKMFNGIIVRKETGGIRVRIRDKLG